MVSREPVFYGMEDCTEKATLVNWALPYAQRYLYKVHPDAYFHLKQSGYEELSRLEVVGVEKLFYKHTVRGCNDTSKKRYDCSSLLQVCNELLLWICAYYNFALICRHL